MECAKIMWFCLKENKITLIIKNANRNYPKLELLTLQIQIKKIFTLLYIWIGSSR